MKAALESYQDHINDCIEMQQMLSDLTDSSLDSTIENIKSSVFYKDINKMKILLSSIGKFLKIRRSQIHNYFHIIDAIFPQITTFYDKEQIMRYFKMKEINLKLLKDNYLTMKDIATYYGIKSTKLQFFYPELPDLLPDHPNLIEDAKQSQKYRDVIDYFTTSQTAKDDPRLKEGNQDNLSIIIRRDDIDSFQSIVSHENINIHKHKIHITLFESNKCFYSNEVYLIEYAAFHCSILIFKYLMMNNAAFSKNLLDFAVCGGNSEIVHISEDAIKQSSKYPDLKELLIESIEFHRYELSEYIIENYDVKVSQKQLLTAVLSDNYNFFTNHILELNDRWNSLSENQSNNSDQQNQKFLEMKRKITELIIMSTEKVDTFFLKVLCQFEDVELNIAFQDQDLQISSPLVNAIQNRNVEASKYLLSLEEVDPDWKVFYGTTPFIWACFIGSLEMVEYLIDNFWTPNKLTNTNENVQTNKNDNVQTNKNDNVQTNKNENVQTNKNENVQTNMNDNSQTNMNENVQTNMNDNVQTNMNDNVQTNMNDNVQTNMNDNSQTNLNNVSKIVNKKIDLMTTVERSNENALHLAVRQNHLDVVKYLVSLNVYDLSAKMSQGETAIESAARLGYREIFDFLKEEMKKAGKDVDENLKVNQVAFLPQCHSKTISLTINMFEGIKNPNEMGICLLL